jgi:hypothetical protein
MSANFSVSDFGVYDKFSKFETMHRNRDASSVNIVAKGW